MREVDTDIYSYDWGGLTVDAFDQNNNIAFVVFNMNLSEQCIDNVYVYTAGMIIWAKKQLPADCKIEIRFDILGLQVSLSFLNDLKERILKGLTSIDESIIADIKFVE